MRSLNNSLHQKNVLKKPSLWHVHAMEYYKQQKKNEVLLLAKNENNADVIV